MTIVITHTVVANKLTTTNTTTTTTKMFVLKTMEHSPEPGYNYDGDTAAATGQLAA